MNFNLRDVVSQAIFKEMEKTNSPYVLLDISFLDENYLKNRFSTIYNKCLEKGTDITKEPIKVSPASTITLWVVLKVRLR